MIKMIFRPLKNSFGKELSVLGLGTWAMGGAHWSGGWGPQSDADSIATIRKAGELGINWIDTAPIYGLGHAEKIVGEALREVRKNWFIASKCGLSWNKRGKIRKELTSFRIGQEIEESLRRLGTDYIDLYQIHWPDEKYPVEKSWKAILKLKKEGKIRFAGVCNFDVTLLKRCLQVGPVDTLQMPYNLFRREIENELLPFCKENNIAVLAYSPLHSGLLSGKFSPERLTERDWRKRHPDFSGKGLEEKRAVLEELAEMAQRQNLTTPELALSWVLNRPGITAAIAGARTPGQLETLASAVNFTWPKDNLVRINNLTEFWRKPRPVGH